jgi:hypothetical protein
MKKIPNYLIHKKCMDCGKQLKKYSAKRCKKCWIKWECGTNNPNFKHGHNCKGKKCLDCNKPISIYAIRCQKCNLRHLWKIGRLNTSGTNNPMFGIHRFGKKAPNWQEGISFEPYSSEFNNSLKKYIRERDNHTCQLCNKKQINLKGYHKKLSIHHIDYDKQNCSENNLIVLCHRCHLKTNFNRDYWYAYFKYIMEKKCKLP